MEQKKEYVAPQMEVVEYVVQASLLEGSPNKQDSADTNETLEDGEFD